MKNMQGSVELAVILVGLFAVSAGCTVDQSRDIPVDAAMESQLDEDLAVSLQTAYRSKQDVGWTVGYADGVKQQFLRWKGVIVPSEYILLSQGGRSGPGLFYHEDQVIDERVVDPPVDYVYVNGGLAEPGHYDNTLRQFYRWRGVRFNPMKVPAAMLGMPRNPQGRFPFRILDIDVPKHRSELANFLNKTTG